MRIVFGWNRIKLKTFTFQELNLPDLEQFPNATIRVVQSYFHIFWIPVFPLGKRVDLVMNKQTYHVPPSLLKAIDPEQLKVRGKWYAWLLPLLAIVIGIGVYINDLYEAQSRKEEEIYFTEMQRQYFDHPAIGDGLTFTDHKNFSFSAEVMDVTVSKVKLIVDLMDILDEEILDNSAKGIVKIDADTLRRIMASRDELVNTSVFGDSLFGEHPDQPIYRKLLTFELEKFPIKYEIIEMPVAEYKSMKKSIGDYYNTSTAKKVKLPSLKVVTKSPVYVVPSQF